MCFGLDGEEFGEKMQNAEMSLMLLQGTPEAVVVTGPFVSSPLLSCIKTLLSMLLILFSTSSHLTFLFVCTFPNGPWSVFIITSS